VLDLDYISILSAFIYMRKHNVVESAGQAGADITIKESELLKEIEAEIISYFRWTSVEGLVEYEGRTIARNVLDRLKGDSKEQPLI